MTRDAARGDADPVAAIKAIYLGTTPATIERDLDRAIAILKTMPSEEDRERAAVYMDGLSQMRSEWRHQGGGEPVPSSSRGQRSRQRPARR